MAGLDDLINQIPVADIANKLGADPGQVSQAIATLVPTLLGSLQENVQADDIDSTELESVVVAEGQSDLLTGGVDVNQLDENQGNQMVASLFGGNDTNQVASALSGAGAPGGDLIKRLLPMLAPSCWPTSASSSPRRTPGALRRRPRRAAAWATSWAASSVGRPVAVAVATTRSAPSSAVCWAVVRATRAARWAASWAGCCAAASNSTI